MGPWHRMDGTSRARDPGGGWISSPGFVRAYATLRFPRLLYCHGRPGRFPLAPGRPESGSDPRRRSGNAPSSPFRRGRSTPGSQGPIGGRNAPEHLHVTGREATPQGDPEPPLAIGPDPDGHGPGGHGAESPFVLCWMHGPPPRRSALRWMGRSGNGRWRGEKGGGMGEWDRAVGRLSSQTGLPVRRVAAGVEHR